MKKKIIQHLSKDPILKPLLSRIPFPESTKDRDLYQHLLGCIISQQLSTKVADVIQGRFINLFDNGYPDPAKLADMETETLRSVGLSNQKASYMRNVAAFFIEENIIAKNWDGMDNEAIIHYLTQIKGVGKWTVEMILMFTLNRPDVMPVDDYGIQTAMARLYQLEEKGKELRTRMVEIASPWQPFRSYACYYLWRFKDGA